MYPPPHHDIWTVLSVDFCILLFAMSTLACASTSTGPAVSATLALERRLVSFRHRQPGGVYTLPPKRSDLRC